MMVFTPYLILPGAHHQEAQSENEAGFIIDLHLFL